MNGFSFNAQLLDLEHEEKNLRRCERWLEDPPQSSYKTLNESNYLLFDLKLTQKYINKRVLV